MSSPPPVFTTSASELPRDLSTLILSYIGASSEAGTAEAAESQRAEQPSAAASSSSSSTNLAGVALVNREWHKITQPRLDQELERTMRGTVLWCNTSKPSPSAPLASYRILTFQSGDRDLYLMMDARQENQEAMQVIQDALCDVEEEGGLNYHHDDDGELCDRGTVRFKWVREDETSESLWVEGCASEEDKNAQLEKAGLFSHVEALRKIRDLPPTNIIVVNGLLDLEKIRATIEKEREYWAKIKEDPESEMEDDTMGAPGFCGSCERRCPPSYWLLTNIHEHVDANGPIHKPGFVPHYDPKARWVCLYWSYEGNGRTTYLIDAREANKEVLQLLWEKKPDEDSDDYFYHWIPATWGDDEQGVDEGQARHELMCLKAPWGFEPRLQVFRGELELEPMNHFFESDDCSNTFDAIDDSLVAKPGTEAWPQEGAESD